MNAPYTVVLGLSRSGVGATRLLRRLGQSVWLSEFGAGSSEAQQAWLAELATDAAIRVEVGGHSASLLAEARSVVVSPGIPPTTPILQAAMAQGLAIRSEVALALASPLAARVRRVGITGSNGKSTITELLTHLLSHLGQEAYACGNVGTSVADTLLKASEAGVSEAVLVMELSSYQLHYSEGLGVEVGIFSNLTPDHLQWHGGLAGYEAAKARLFFKDSGEAACRVAVLNAEDATGRQWLERRLSHSPTAETLAYGRTLAAVASYPKALAVHEGAVWEVAFGVPTRCVASLADWPLPGSHNQENLLAALGGLAGLGLLQHPALPAALASFGGVPHRLQCIAQQGGWQFVNDSKATNPEAAEVALAAFPNRALFYLAGGQDKGTPLDAWAACVCQHAHSVALYGACANLFAEALGKAGFPAPRLSQHEGLEEAFSHAYQTLKASTEATQAAVLLLSPAAASQDQYSDFEARGRHFVALAEGVVSS